MFEADPTDPMMRLPIARSEKWKIAEDATRHKLAAAVLLSIVALGGAAGWAASQLGEGGRFHEYQTEAGWVFMAGGVTRFVYRRYKELPILRDPIPSLVTTEAIAVGVAMLLSGQHPAEQHPTSPPVTAANTITLIVPRDAGIPCADTPPHQVQPGENLHAIVQGDQHYTDAETNIFFARVSGAAEHGIIHAGEMVKVTCS